SQCLYTCSNGCMNTCSFRTIRALQNSCAPTCNNVCYVAVPVTTTTTTTRAPTTTTLPQCVLQCTNMCVLACTNTLVPSCSDSCQPQCVQACQLIPVYRVGQNNQYSKSINPLPTPVLSSCPAACQPLCLPSCGTFYDGNGVTASPPQTGITLSTPQCLRSCESACLAQCRRVSTCMGPCQTNC
ncbi:hypothetical protein PFISCL1PPCAC_8271, partial [Pristionchus fissidentatus]